MGRLLVIEDEQGFRLLLQNRLEDLGYEVATASTGAMGLMEARAGRFDLFLVDIALGTGVDGYEVCRRLKGMPQTVGVPVVLITAEKMSREDKHRGFEAGCESFLVKGDMTELEDVIRAMLRIKSLQDDLGIQNRLLEKQNRLLQEEKQRGADLELALRESGSRQLVFRELAVGRPDGVLMVDGEGTVRCSDRGAREIMGKDLEGRQLGSLAPASGLEAFVRDARTEPREGFRFDLSNQGGRGARSLSASVMPMVTRASPGEPGLRIVLLLDAGKRRVASEMLRMQEQGLPRRELGPLLEAARRSFHPSRLLGGSPPMVALRTRVSKMAPTDNPVLIRGETGTGKELIARSMHFAGTRSGAFIPVNCRALSPRVLESEFFGHIKGAFIGAFSDRPGFFHQAHMGTIYLEEVHSLSSELQLKVLKVLEQGEVTRVGAQKRDHVDVRVIASTTADLDLEVEEGRFNRDLYLRLSAVDLNVPTLAQREGDVALALGERRDVQIDGAETQVEVAVEAPLLDLQVEVGGRRGDHADVHVVALLGTDAGDLALLQDLQDLELELGGQAVDLLQVDRPHVGLVKEPGAVAEGPDEGPLDVPEELALEDPGG